MTQSRSALVTGASRGIGAEVARALSAQGYRVAVHYSSSLGSAQAVHAELDGDGHVVVRADLRDPEQVQAMVDEVAAQFGTIDVLVNNAGVFFAHPIDEVDYQTWQEAWRETLDVNLVGPANVTWCAVRHMGPGGRIINVGSRGAFRGEPHSPAYGASKAAIAAFGQSLARYLGGRGGHHDRAGLRRDRHGHRGARRRRRRGEESGEPLQSRGHDGRHRGGGRLPRVFGGGVGERRHPRSQWRLLSAHVRVSREGSR